MVAGDFALWNSALDGWSAYAFEDFFAGPYPATTGCVSLPGVLSLLSGAITLELSNGGCTVFDGTSAFDAADGSIPQGETLTLRFAPPIRAFYSPYGSLAVDEQVTLHLLGGGGLDETLISPPSFHGNLGRGFGFVSSRPVDTIEISSSEEGHTLLGYFVGLVASDQSITSPGGFPCSNAPCDFAFAFDPYRPGTFVTPSAGTGDLSSWPEVGFETGIAAGDAICEHWANEAGFPVPQRFVAFLGVGDTDPLCRVLGLTGRISEECDGAVPAPRRARWWRVDGLPWGAPLDGNELATVRPSLDANGDRVEDRYFTAWQPVGATCGNWTSTAGGTNFGNPSAMDGSWLFEGGTLCSSEHRLLCVERALGLLFPPEAAAGRTAFVSVANGTGNIPSWPEADPAATSGLDAADSICESEAEAAGLAAPSSFRAWLSTSEQDAVDRLTEPGAYVRTDGVLVATSIPDLVDGLVETGIARYAGGGFATSLAVWTGTSASGVFSGMGCGDWESTAGEGRAGSTARANGDWTDQRNLGCSFEAHLFCVSDAVAPLFADGFESGSLSAWSQSVP